MSKNKQEAINLIKKKLNNESFLSYVEIGELTGYHEKYILKLKRDLINGNVSFEHGNKNRKPINAISDEEKKQIIDMYKRSRVSIRKFCMFYGTRSYSCVYNVIMEYKNSLK